MCFFVYSPTNCLALKYVSEKITPIQAKYKNLNRHNRYCGSSNIIIDIVLENTGTKPELGLPTDTPINELYIIYPNVLFTEPEQGKEIRTQSHFEDITFPFITETYEQLVRSPRPIEDLTDITKLITSSYVDDIVINPIDADREHYEIKFTIPDPNNLDAKTIESEVFGSVEINLVNDLPNMTSRLLYHLLSLTHMSILRCTFQPIEVGRSRWMKFNIRPRTTGNILPKSWRGKTVALFFNANFYFYEIKGPYNVRYEFFKRLESFTQKLEILYKKHEQNGDSPDSISNIILPYKKKIDQGLLLLKKTIGDYHHTKIEDWRIEISSNSGDVSGIREYGVFRISGSLANAIEGKNKRREIIYTWKSGKKNVCFLEEAIDSVCASMKRPELLDCQSQLVEGCTDEGCYPYSGNFRIAYRWKKDSSLLKYIIILLTLFGLMSVISGCSDFLIQLVKKLTA